ncbi:MAG: tRNA threonylcarbamoyladenosine dehydratase [Spirochaetales bacterium]
MIDLSYENRFGGLARLYGPGVLARLRRSQVTVVGLGGVGSWAVEALARSGIGHLTLIDLDDVCATNTNRQLPALDPEWGRLKAEVLADRVVRINPDCEVRVVADFVTARSAPRLLEPSGDRPQVVIDAIDSLADKAALVQACLELGLPVLVCGAAGGRSDPTQVRYSDLGRTQRDPLLKSLKKSLKARGLSPDPQGLWGVEGVFSLEAAVMPWEVCSSVPRPDEGGSARIDCADGYGSSAFATGTFGLTLASRAVARLLR